MLPDSGNLPMAGGVLLAAGLYAGVSLFATGPLVGERLIAKSDWAKVCPAIARSDAERRSPPPVHMPSNLCQSTLGVLYGKDGAAYCRVHGPAFDKSITDLTDVFVRPHEQLRQSRLAHAAGQAADRCSCAANVTLESRRIDFAIHAGTLRFITPLPVTTLRSELSTALRSPTCAMKE